MEEYDRWFSFILFWRLMEVIRELEGGARG